MWAELLAPATLHWVNRFFRAQLGDLRLTIIADDNKTFDWSVNYGFVYWKVVAREAALRLGKRRLVQHVGADAVEISEKMHSSELLWWAICDMKTIEPNRLDEQWKRLQRAVAEGETLVCGPLP